VPVAGITASAAVMLLGVGLNYLVPKEAFVWVTSISLVGSLWTWAIIMIAHLGYRRAVAEGRSAPVGFHMPGAPVANWLVVAFLCWSRCSSVSTRRPGSRSMSHRCGSAC
jgi:AAT family amino acid transporter/D-serine/D-alanine/glycine transporter